MRESLVQRVKRQKNSFSIWLRDPYRVKVNYLELTFVSISYRVRIRAGHDVSPQTLRNVSS